MMYKNNLRQTHYIHIEGMDLAGKSTLVKNLSNSLSGHWAIRKNSLSQDNPVYLLADSLRRGNKYDSETLGNLYVAAMMADIHDFTWPDTNTLQDSTILLRSLAFHTVNSTPRLAEALSTLAIQHPKFSYSIVLIANIQTRLKRLEQRRLNSPDDLADDDFMIIQNPQKFLAMEASLIKSTQQLFDVDIVNTSQLSPEEVTESVRQLIALKTLS